MPQSLTRSVTRTIGPGSTIRFEEEIEEAENGKKGVPEESLAPAESQDTTLPLDGPELQKLQQASECRLFE